MRSETDERQVFYFYSTSQKKLLDKITKERELSQLKHWLKTTHKISIEEFVVLFKVYEAEKISGKIERYITF